MFTEIALAQARPYWEGSFTHPFIKELVAGDLASTAFRYYLLQDRYYLEHFSKIHLLIAQQSSDTQVKALMYQSANNLADGEQMVRHDFFQELQIKPAEIAQTPIAPTAYHYVSHMYRQLVEHTPNVALASLLPCAWLYQAIGQRLATKGSPNQLYQRWIDTYASDEMTESVQTFKQIINHVYADPKTTPAEQQEMVDAFVISSAMEYNFWGMAYELETWPSDAKIQPKSAKPQ
ncbi:thiaminase II [Agrilactobacillus fermenti]|uniref:thiaminase II n=1 Tax=Agrilactobacillus fermenti TaxID=2586909 RepID=UPI003A5BF7A2